MSLLLQAPPRAHEEGRAAEAHRLYALALALVPDNAELARRSGLAAEKAAVAGGLPGGAPTEEDGLPRLEVRAVDDTGRAIAGARITLMRGPLDAEAIGALLRRPPGEGATDAAGRFRIGVRPGQWAVLVRLPLPALRGAVTMIDVPITGSRIDVPILRGERVTGHVVDRVPVDRKDAPLGGVDVYAGPDVDSLGPEIRAVSEARTEANGSFVLEGMDPGDYRLFAASETHLGYFRGESIGHARENVLLKLQRQQVLRGRVLLSSAGKPPAAAERFTISSPELGERRFESADGRFELRFLSPNREALVQFSVEGRPPVVKTLALDRLECDAGEVTIGAGRSLRGTVVDPRGAPVFEATIWSMPWKKRARTTSDGTFELQIEDAPVELVVSHPRWRVASQQVPAGQTELTIRLRAGDRLTLLAVDEDGTPIGDAGFSAGSPQELPWPKCLTVPSGRCDLEGLAPGELELHALGTPQGRLVPPHLFLPPAPGQSSRAIAVRWPRQASRLELRLSSADGAPVRGAARVFPGVSKLAAAMGPDGNPRLPFHWIRTDRPLENLPAGKYLVVATDPTCAMSLVTIRGDATTTAALTPGDGSCNGPRPAGP